MPDIGQHIAHYRKQNRQTQEQLASALHVTRQTVSSWENERTLPDVETLAAVASALHVSVEELIYGKRTAPPAEDIRLPRHRRVAVIMGICAILAVLLEGVWPDLQAALSPTAQLFLQCLLRPSIWIFCTVQLLALISMKRSLSLKKGPLRAAALMAGVAALAFYLALCLAEQGVLHSEWMERTWRAVNHNAWLFFLPGAALFLGLDR